MTHVGGSPGASLGAAFTAFGAYVDGFNFMFGDNQAPPGYGGGGGGGGGSRGVSVVEMCAAAGPIPRLEIIKLCRDMAGVGAEADITCGGGNDGGGNGGTTNSSSFRMSEILNAGYDGMGAAYEAVAVRCGVPKELVSAQNTTSGAWVVSLQQTPTEKDKTSRRLQHRHQHQQERSVDVERLTRRRRLFDNSSDGNETSMTVVEALHLAQANAYDRFVRCFGIVLGCILGVMVLTALTTDGVTRLVCKPQEQKKYGQTVHYVLLRLLLLLSNITFVGVCLTSSTAFQALNAASASLSAPIGGNGTAAAAGSAAFSLGSSSPSPPSPPSAPGSSFRGTTLVSMATDSPATIAFLVIAMLVFGLAWSTALLLVLYVKVRPQSVEVIEVHGDDDVDGGDEEARSWEPNPLRRRSLRSRRSKRRIRYTSRSGSYVRDSLDLAHESVLKQLQQQREAHKSGASVESGVSAGGAGGVGGGVAGLASFSLRGGGGGGGPDDSPSDSTVRPKAMRIPLASPALTYLQSMNQSRGRWVDIDLQVRNIAKY